MNILNEIHASEPDLLENKWLSFNEFGDFSLGLTFIYYIKAGGDIGAVQSRINLSILERFNIAGLSFAFPTQTIFTEELK